MYRLITVIVFATSGVFIVQLHVCHQSLRFSLSPCADVRNSVLCKHLQVPVCVCVCVCVCVFVCVDDKSKSFVHVWTLDQVFMVCVWEKLVTF